MAGRLWYVNRGIRSFKSGNRRGQCGIRLTEALRDVVCCDRQCLRRDLQCSVCCNRKRDVVVQVRIRELRCVKAHRVGFHFIRRGVPLHVGLSERIGAGERVVRIRVGNA